ncbi:hypothetical protein HPB47_001202 [Ixodes persulcatus]|uniref:Uncharacterized protein n=1 Tax=Ixodes persulcatus TaxID=34615 RepID=A0AC60PPP2_IXOPE|nr:hypothetical protein HPB47_001202 [Ixodes persulcatus]
MANSEPQKRYFQAFLKSYLSEFPCVVPSKKGEKFGLRSTCTCDESYDQLAAEMDAFYACQSLPVSELVESAVYATQVEGSWFRVQLVRAGRGKISRALELQLLRRVLPSCLTNLFGSGYCSHPSYLFIVDAASRLLEASWKEVIAGVTASCHKLNETKFEPAVLLCNTALSSDTIELLSKGPKFAPDLPTKKVDQLAIAAKDCWRCSERGTRGLQTLMKSPGSFQALEVGVVLAVGPPLLHSGSKVSQFWDRVRKELGRRDAHNIQPGWKNMTMQQRSGHEAPVVSVVVNSSVALVDTLPSWVILPPLRESNRIAARHGATRNCYNGPLQPWNGRLAHVYRNGGVNPEFTMFADKKADCYFVDHGDMDTVDVLKLQELDPRFLGLPFQAVQCRLDDLLEFAGDERAGSLLADLVVGKCLVAEAVSSFLSSQLTADTVQASLEAYDYFEPCWRD